MPDYSELIFRVKKQNSEQAIREIGAALDKTSSSAAVLQSTLAKIAGFVGVSHLAKTLITASDSVRRVDQSFRSVFQSTEKATAELKKLQRAFNMTEATAKRSMGQIGNVIRTIVPKDALVDVAGEFQTDLRFPGVSARIFFCVSGASRILRKHSRFRGTSRFLHRGTLAVRFSCECRFV